MGDIISACPGCHSMDLTGFYTIENVPVNSCIMLDTASESGNFPTGNISLTFCNDCCFIFNSSFKKTFTEYSARYEDQQGYSETFNRFQERLVSVLVDRYRLQGKTVLEIGCGKGDFLTQLCRAGRAIGTGIDPAVNLKRIQDNDLDISFLPEFFSRKHFIITADLVCCRHTLEHISYTAEFINLLSQHVRARDTSVNIFFEVPDSGRILDKACFQDIYYEHCSYFTPGSLTQLFVRHGFSVESVRYDYNDQYLLLFASSSDTGSFLPAGNEKDRIADKVARFSSEVHKSILHWRNVVSSCVEENKTIILWGSGSKCVAFIHAIELDLNNIEIVDINPHRQGKYPPGIGKAIKSPSDIDYNTVDLVIIMNEIYLEEIKKHISQCRNDIRIMALE